MPGQRVERTRIPIPSVRRKEWSVEDYIDGILDGNRMMLGRAISLVESRSPKHADDVRKLIRKLLPHSGNSVRVGITGVPGAGKSTLIEALGCALCDKGRKVAVLAVDPSSSRTGGSILGDKTRMEQLSRMPGAFIRPSPSGGNLGGVTRKSRETIVLCEAFGFDTVLVETVGVGQSETTVRSIVDFFMLITIAGGGDELQGMKKGIMELADAIVVNKADGSNLRRCQMACAEFRRVLRYLAPATQGWESDVLACSALHKEGMDQIWETVMRFCEQMKESGGFEARRRAQKLAWMEALTEQGLREHFQRHPVIRRERAQIEEQVLSGKMPASAGAETLIDLYLKGTGGTANGAGQRANPDK